MRTNPIVRQKEQANHRLAPPFAHYRVSNKRMLFRYEEIGIQDSPGSCMLLSLVSNPSIGQKRPKRSSNQNWPFILYTSWRASLWVCLWWSIDVRKEPVLNSCTRKSRHVITQLVCINLRAESREAFATGLLFNPQCYFRSRMASKSRSLRAISALQRTGNNDHFDWWKPRNLIVFWFEQFSCFHRYPVLEFPGNIGRSVWCSCLINSG